MPRLFQDMPSITVISTVLNEARGIDALVDSLARQTLQPAEIVMVDGGSTDGTWEKLQAAQSRCPLLRPIRDESCNLRASLGPISRGRNVAISLAKSAIIACADAGCTYRPDWLAELTAPIVGGEAEYALGGSCIGHEGRTVWDIAAAPFLGIHLSPDARTRSCTARSMAFTKRLWQWAGGFPESSFMIDDAGYDLRVRRGYRPAFVRNAKAFYAPHHTLRSALVQLARYAFGDGVSGHRWARLGRNLARCLAWIGAVALLRWSFVALIAVVLLEIYFALRLDWRGFRQELSRRTLGARLLYSFLVPWVVAWNQIEGMVRKVNPPNAQNAALRGPKQGSGARG